MNRFERPEKINQEEFTEPEIREFNVWGEMLAGVVRDPVTANIIRRSLIDVGRIFLDPENSQATDIFRNTLGKIASFSKDHPAQENNPSLKVLESVVSKLRNSVSRKQGNNAKNLYVTFAKAWEAKYSQYELFIQDRLETIISEYAERDNEGMNGVILKLDLSNLPAELKSGVEELESDWGEQPEKTQAIKLLKIYKPGTAQKEFQLQDQFHQSLESLPEEQYAKVPRPWTFHELHIPEDQDNQGRIDKLAAKGFPVLEHSIVDEGGNKQTKRSIDCELIIMDYVEGKDLATVMFEWIIAHPPDGKGDVVPQSRSRTFFDIRMQAMHTLGLYLEDEEPLTPQAQIEVNKIITNHLKKTGFTVSSQVVNKLQNTEQALIQKKLFHPDAHERNIIIEGDIASTDNPAKVYLVDFGEVPEGTGKMLNTTTTLLREFEQPKVN